MVKQKKGMGAWIWILILIVLLGAGIGAYFLLSGGSVPQPPALPTG